MLMGIIQCEREIDDAEGRGKDCLSSVLDRAEGTRFSTPVEGLPQERRYSLFMIMRRGAGSMHRDALRWVDGMVACASSLLMASIFSVQ